MSWQGQGACVYLITMSQFILYKSRRKPLSQIGSVDRLIYILTATVIPILIFSGIIIDQLNITGSVLIFAVSLWVFMIIALVIYSRYINRSLEKLGDLEVTLKGIRKTIGGFETYFDYEQIKEINIKDHIRSIFFPENKDASKTYVVSITGKDSVKEMFVISSQSVNKPRVNFLESLKYIEKYKNIKLKITR